VDKSDALVGLAAAGCLPTASADRYGLRRVTYGLLQTLIRNNVHASLRALVATAAAVQPIDVSVARQQEICDFVERRLEQFILDEGDSHLTRVVSIIIYSSLKYLSYIIRKYACSHSTDPA
jgi:glycyl-tRNA synthetase